MIESITKGKSRPYLSPPHLKITPPEGGGYPPSFPSKTISKKVVGNDDEDKVKEDKKMIYLDKLLDNINEKDFELNEDFRSRLKLKGLEKNLLFAKTDLAECRPRYKGNLGKLSKCISLFKEKIKDIINRIALLRQRVKEDIKMNENDNNMGLESMVDNVLDTLVEKSEVDILVDNLLDNIGYRRPYDNQPKMGVTTGIESGEGDEDYVNPAEEPAEVDNSDNETNDINNIPNQDAPTMMRSLKKDIGEHYSGNIILQVNNLLKEDSAYQKFFKRMLSKYGVKSPSELSDEKKKAFFNMIDKAWKAKEETD